MPIYEYRCNECSRKFEVRRGFSDDSPVPCPDCKGVGQRLFSPVPIIFKGTGFYVTDNRKEENSESSSGPEESSSKEAVDTGVD